MGNCPTLLGPAILAAMHSQSTLFKLDAVWAARETFQASSLLKKRIETIVGEPTWSGKASEGRGNLKVAGNEAETTAQLMMATTSPAFTV